MGFSSQPSKDELQKENLKKFSKKYNEVNAKIFDENILMKGLLSLLEAYKAAKNKYAMQTLPLNSHFSKD